MEEPRKPIVAVRNSDMAKLGTLQAKQSPLKVYADRRGPRTCEKLVDEQIQSHAKNFTRKLKGDQKTKQRRRDPGSGLSSSQSYISRAMRGRIPKLPNFTLIRNQPNEDQAASHSELILPPQLASLSALQQVAPAVPTTQGKCASDRNRRSPSYYGFNYSSSDSTITAPLK